MLVIDETGFLKQGKASCGVARQYTGSAGKITNCQIGVFAAYVSRHGHAFIDRALHLPKEWTDDRDRLEAAYVPADVGFATKPKLARRMIARAIAASVPFKWVAGDTVYGVGDIEQQLRRAGKGYVLGVSSAHVFQSWGKRPPVAGTAGDIARTRRSSDWKRLSAGAGTKGPRLHDWCHLELADLEGEQRNSANDGLWARGLLDTNVLSELMRPAPSTAVESWMGAQPVAGIFISTITEAELRYGLALLPDGRRQRRLIAQADAMLVEDFANRLFHSIVPRPPPMPALPPRADSRVARSPRPTRRSPHRGPARRFACDPKCF
ncbi:hypothetical protein BH10PSE6_BH10PSE6_00990 [soil metagenome]